MDQRKTVLFIGDAACDSGFSKNTHHLCAALHPKFDVHVLGLNYRGDPHSYPYPIYPCWPGGDAFGSRRLLRDDGTGLIDKIQPDVIVIQNDPWNVPAYTKEIDKLAVTIPTVGIMAVDGLNCRGTLLNKLTRVVFWTKFAEEEARKGGMTVPSAVIPLGVDLDLFKPGDKLAARKKIGLPEDVLHGFFVTNINRNQPRKRLDLTIRIFGRWVQERNVQDAFLYLHVSPTGDVGWDCNQLAKYYGFSTPTNKRLILAEPETYHGASEEMIVTTMQAADVGFSTTQGEGWGLPTMEMMACEIPQVLPRWSALGEWAAPGALMVECPTTSTTPIANAIGGILDEDEAIEALDLMYRDAATRATYARRGRVLVEQECYRWPNIGERFVEEVEKAVGLRS